MKAFMNRPGLTIPVNEPAHLASSMASRRHRRIRCDGVVRCRDHVNRFPFFARREVLAAAYDSRCPSNLELPATKTKHQTKGPRHFGQKNATIRALSWLGNFEESSLLNIW